MVVNFWWHKKRDTAKSDENSWNEESKKRGEMVIIQRIPSFDLSLIIKINEALNRLNFLQMSFEIVK